VNYETVAVETRAPFAMSRTSVGVLPAAENRHSISANVSSTKLIVGGGFTHHLDVQYAHLTDVPKGRHSAMLQIFGTIDFYLFYQWRRSSGG
jgi:hypothetical protein